MLGWVGPEYRLTALSIAGVVCIASSNGGTTSQDLKTGFLVGATPWKQQVAILVGALISALVMGGTLARSEHGVHDRITDDPADLPTRQGAGRRAQGDRDRQGWKVLSRLVGVNPRPGVQPGKYLVDESLARPRVSDRSRHRRPDDQDRRTGTPIQKFNPPQPRLFATLIEGIMARDLPWGLVILGAVLAIVMQLCGVSALAFAVGVYLPLSTTLPIFVGGMLRKAGRPRSRIHARRGRDEPRHLDVDRPDRRRLARRHHHRVPGRL